MNSPELLAYVEDVVNPSKTSTVRPLGYNVRHDMRESPDDFSLTIDPRDGGVFNGAGMQKVSLFFNRPGKGATLRMVGRTDERDGSTTADSRGLTVQGRDMSLHLTDTDAPVGSIANQTLQHFTEQCATPFGIGVEIPGFPNAPVNSDGEFSFVTTDPQLATYKMAGRNGGKKHAAFTAARSVNSKDWRIQPNTPCWQAIATFAKQIGVVPFMLGRSICLTRPNYDSDLALYGNGITVAKQGGNALTSDLRVSTTGRYAVYKAKTKRTVKSPETTATPGGTTINKAKTSTQIFRDYVVDPSPGFWKHIDPNPSNPAGLLARFSEQTSNIDKDIDGKVRIVPGHGRSKEVRGQWFGDETLMGRALRSEMESNVLSAWEYTVTMEGLTAENGSYWTQDTMVPVVDLTHEGFGITRPLYIVGIEESLQSGDDKPVTTLSLIPPKIWLHYNDVSPEAYADNMRRQVFF